jgi:hypothetical protein
MQMSQAIPMHVHRVIEMTLQQQPRATRLVLSRAVMDATFCEPKQATEWVGDALRYVSR